MIIHVYMYMYLMIIMMLNFIIQLCSMVYYSIHIHVHVGNYTMYNMCVVEVNSMCRGFHNPVL